MRVKKQLMEKIDFCSRYSGLNRRQICERIIEEGLDKYIKVNLEDSHISDHEILSISADIFESFLGAIYNSKRFNSLRDYFRIMTC